MQADNTLEEINVEDPDAILNFIQTNLQAILDGRKMDCHIDMLYRLVYFICSRFGNGLLVRNGVRQIVKEYLDKMVAKLENMADSQEPNNQVMLQIDAFWFNFADQMRSYCNCLGLLHLDVGENVPQFFDDEQFLQYIWQIFRTKFLENELIKNALANRLVLLIPETNNSSNAIAHYRESPYFNVDTIIEIMTFLTTLKLGLQVSTAARQMAKLSDYVLNKRKRILRPIAVFNGVEQNAEPFATRLQKERAPYPDPERKKMQKIFADLFANNAPERRICLPDIEPPEWITGVELIYIKDAMHDKTFRFLNVLRDQLHNCQLIFNISGFFAKLQQAGLSSQFLALFNERCFSLVNTLPWHCCTNDFTAKWPLWAIFNGIFFPNCRELTLPRETLEVDEVDAAKWLMHPSTEHQPRMLKLCSAQYDWIGNELVTLLRLIKEDFFNPTGKRMFFVEFPNEPAELGEWQNGNGELLRIHPTGTTRLPVDQSDKKFKDFYKLPAVQTKLVFK